MTSLAEALFTLSVLATLGHLSQRERQGVQFHYPTLTTIFGIRAISCAAMAVRISSGIM